MAAESITADQRAELLAAVERSRVAASLPASGRMAFYLELNATASGTVYQNTIARGEVAAANAAKNAKATITRLQDAAIRALPSALPNTTVLYRTAAISAGVAVETDVANYHRLFALPHVKAVNPITPKVLDNAGTADLIRAPEVWTSFGNTGDNVEIGIIDTGIDYTHTLFGGSGSVDQYNAIREVEDQPHRGASSPA